MGKRLHIAIVLLSLYYLTLFFDSCPQAMASEVAEGNKYSDVEVEETPNMKETLLRQKRQDAPAAPASPVTLPSTFSTYSRNVSAEAIRLIDDKTMEIDKMVYDGTGPATWFVVGNKPNWNDERTDLGSTIIPNEKGSCDKLKAYDKANIKLVLPGDMKWTDYNFLAVFCIEHKHNFGSVNIPSDLTSTLAKGTADPNLKTCTYSKSKDSGNSTSTAASIGGPHLGGLINILGIYALYSW